MNILEVNYSDTYFKKVIIDVNKLFFLKKVLEAIIFALRQVIKDIIFLRKNESINDKVICFANSVNQKKCFITIKK